MRLSTRLMLAMVALVLLSATIIGVWTYRNVEATVMPRALAGIQARARLLALDLEASVRSARADVLGFRSAVAVDGIVRASLAGGADPNGTTVAQWRDRLAQRFVAELAAKPDYTQFRIIGVADGGREILRVNHSGPSGAIRIAPESELLQRGDRGYFQRALRLAPNEVDISPVELNLSEDRPGAERLPVLRAAAPIYGPDGKPFGAVIINVGLGEIFKRLRNAGEAGIVYLVNERGDYLIHPDVSREFGFEFGKPQRLQDDFPSLADVLTATPDEPRVVRDRAGTQFGVAPVSVRLAQGPVVTVVLAWPYQRVLAPAFAVRNTILLAGIFTVVLALALAILLARSIAQPLEEMTTAVEAFGRGEPHSVPVEAGGEIGALSRAFAKMASDVREKGIALDKETDERRHLFETSLDLILIVDREGKFIRVSPSVETILGLRPEDMIGHSGTDFIYPEDLDNTRNEMRAARRGKQMRYFDCRYVHKDGRVVPLQWAGVWSEPMQLHFFIGRDMTERKKAEDALLEGERTARGIIDTALDAFVQMDESGVITDWNPYAETLFGWKRAEAIGRKLADAIVPPAHRDAHAAGLARFLRTGEGAILGKRFEIDAQARDGRIFRVELAVTALHRRGGYIFNAFIRDLTDKIAADTQLRQAQKMDAIGQLTGGVAHDFNNILTVITGTIEIIADGVANDPQLAAVAKMIDEAASRGSELTQQLLAFARRQPLQPRMIDINLLITETARLLRPTLGEQIEIEAMLEDDAWTAMADPSQLTTALLNLAVNARDAMPHGGKLTLESGNIVLDEAYAQANPDAKPGAYVLVAVSDTGSGIPAELIDKVFEPFFTTKDIGKGTGLGLSMVYGFVKQSDGHIKVYSEEGHGTTIKIYLPRADAKPEPAAAAASAAVMPRGNEFILVVEDDTLVREYVVAQLNSLGYATLTAPNAAAALQLVNEGVTFDLLFTDVIMPGGMNGRELALEMARLRPDTRVLFTSGYTENAIVHHGRLDPGVALLNKPYRKKDLAEKIRSVLDGPQFKT